MHLANQPCCEDYRLFICAIFLLTLAVFLVPYCGAWNAVENGVPLECQLSSSSRATGEEVCLCYVPKYNASWKCSGVIVMIPLHRGSSAFERDIQQTVWLCCHWNRNTRADQSHRYLFVQRIKIPSEKDDDQTNKNMTQIQICSTSKFSILDDLHRSRTGNVVPNAIFDILHRKQWMNRPADREKISCPSWRKSANS